MQAWESGRPLVIEDMTHEGETNDRSNAERAYRLFKRAARDMEGAGALTAEQVTARLRTVSERILDLLGGGDSGRAEDEVMSSLERQSCDIADDLRRVERLMKHHPSDDE
jgi:hypothetical protein